MYQPHDIEFEIPTTLDVTLGDPTYPVLLLELRIPPVMRNGVAYPTATVWVPSTLVDAAAKMLSRLADDKVTMPGDEEVLVYYKSILKATYKEGVRTEVRSIQDLQILLPGEHISHPSASVMIFDSSTNEWV